MNRTPISIRRMAALLLVPALLAGLLAASPTRENRIAHRKYLGIYEDHTQKLVLYRGVATALILRATWLDESMRRAIADERKLMIAPSDENHQEYLADLLEEGKTYHEIVFSADSGMENGDDFGTSDAGWVIRLFADGTEEDLVTAYRVKNPNPLQRTLYPHFNLWSDLWIARFARTVERPKKVSFTVGSGYGNGKVVWEAGN